MGGLTFFSVTKQRVSEDSEAKKVTVAMCLAIPAKVLEIQGDVAKVDFGQGVAREVNVMLVEAHVGEYVLVHAGYAIEKLDQKAAEESLNTWREILEQM
jgi:hydrogenase expression/formation protein HypC